MTSVAPPARPHDEERVPGQARPAGRTLPADLGAAAAAIAARLRDAGVASPEVDAAWLLEAVTGLRPSEQRLHAGAPLTAAARRRLAGWLARREQREPLQVILGETSFYGLRVRLASGVLVPRPETEALVALVLDDLVAYAAAHAVAHDAAHAVAHAAAHAVAHGPEHVAALPRAASDAVVPGAAATVIDVGTGSGAVALALAAERPGLRVVASDVEPAAVALARRNARALGLPVEVVRSDLLAHPRLARAAREAAVLVANLPYLPASDRAALPAELAWEPAAALFGGPDGLREARRLRAQAWRALSPGATVWLELDPRNATPFAREARALGWRDVRLAADLVGRRRFVRLLR